MFVNFAKSISIIRDGAYKVFEKEKINTALLQKISDVLEHDFFNYYSSPPAVKDNKGNYGYATKEELKQLTDTILKEIEKLRNELSKDPAKPLKEKSAKRKK